MHFNDVDLVAFVSVYTNNWFYSTFLDILDVSYIRGADPATSPISISMKGRMWPQIINSKLKYIYYYCWFYFDNLNRHHVQISFTNIIQNIN